MLKKIQSLVVLFVALALPFGFSAPASASSGSSGNFKFYGTVQSMPAGLYGTWVVDGRTVNVTPATQIKQKYGPITVGSYVEVKGWLQASGAVDATKVEGKRGSSGGGPVAGGYVKFYGFVQSMPAGLYGAWIVDGRTVNVSPSTWIKQKYGPIGVGTRVEVKGYQQADGSVNAIQVEGKRW